VTREERQEIREAAIAAQLAISDRWRQRHEGLPKPPPRPWQLQTSNSFRRIGAQGDGDVLCATTHPSDRHPDLLAPPGVLDYVVAVQPSVVLRLLDQLDVAEQLLARLSDVEARLDETDRKFREAQVLVETLRAAVAKGGAA